MFDLEVKNEMKIAILESASSVRQMQVDTMRGLRFDQIQSFSSGKEALGYMEVETPDWLIMSSMDMDDVNCLQILKIISENGRLRDTRTSLIIDPGSESFLLPMAFELGLMSYHPKTFSKEDFESGFSDLFTLFAMNHHDPVLVSSQYLQAHLREIDAHKSNLALGETILKMYPGHPKVLFSLAEAQFLCDRPEAGETTLHQVTMLEPKLNSAATRLLTKHTKKTSLDEKASIGGTNILGVKSVVVIDPDTAVVKQIETLLTRCGVKTLECFEDGDQAWNWIKDHPEPSLIIQEWKIAKVSGPLLVQRIRNHGYVQVPIIVASSLLEEKDFPLVLEMGVDMVLKKPFHDEEFLTAAIWTLQESAKPSEGKSIALKVRRSIACGKLPEALRLLNHFLNDDRIPAHGKWQLQAEYQFADGQILHAKKLCTQIINEGEVNVLTLNLLGKIFLELKDYDSAFEALNRASEICPMNIARLIELADIKVQTGEFDQAQKSISEAESIDKDAEIVKEAGCRLALETGNTDRAAELFTELDSAGKVVSHMNNRAVALARIGHFEDGISLYRQTIDALPHKMEDARLAVIYNLSLAFARYGDYDKSIEELEKIAQKKHRIGTKAAALLARLKKAQENGSSIEFIETSKEKALADAGEEDIEAYDIASQIALDSLKIEAGDICCFKIFFFLEGHDQRCERMLKTIPKFFSRDKIKRERSNTNMRTA